MPSLTSDKKRAMQRRYDEVLNYKTVAKEFEVDARTVKAHVKSAVLGSSSNMWKNQKDAVNTDNGINNSDDTQKPLKESKFASFIKLRQKGYPLLKVVCRLDLSYEEATEYEGNFWKLHNIAELYDIYQQNSNGLRQTVYIFRQMESEDMDPDEYAKQVAYSYPLRTVRERIQEEEQRHTQVKSDNDNLESENNRLVTIIQRNRQNKIGLENEIAELLPIRNALQNDMRATRKK